MSETEKIKNDFKDILVKQIADVNKTFNKWNYEKKERRGEKYQESDKRTQFEKEYDKVLFSAYFRALSDKTQVVPLSKQDHNHNRLTHSLEVASVGYSFGKMLDDWLFCQDGKDQPIERYKDAPKEKDLPLIIATACLLHDIGNPPFGHAGEDAIKHFFHEKFLVKDKESAKHFYYRQTNFYLNEAQINGFRRFDGNANGFRIATRLAGKSPEILPVDYTEAILRTGLKLSNITLAAGLKYPFVAGKYPKDNKKDKFGYFDSESDIFDWLVKSEILPLNKKSYENSPKYIRHPLVYLVEGADDICNLVLDFEDAIINGHANPENLMIDAMKLWGNSRLGFTIYDHKYFIVVNDKILFDLDSETLTQQLELLSKDESLDFKDKEKINEITVNYKKIKSSISKLINYDSNVPIKSEQLKALEAIRSEVLGMLVPCVFEQFKKQFYNLNILEGFLENGSSEPISGLLDLQYGWHICNHNLDKSKIEDFKRKYLNNSLYIHKRKANIEIAGYQITNHILELFFDALAEYTVSKYKFCSTRTKHLLRYIGIDEDNETSLGHKIFSDYQLALKVVDFITKASDTEIMTFYQGITGLNTD